MDNYLHKEKSFHHQLQQRILTFCNIVLFFSFLALIVISYINKNTLTSYVAIFGACNILISMIFQRINQYTVSTYITVVMVSITAYGALLARNIITPDLLYLYVSFQVIPIILSGLLAQSRSFSLIIGALSLVLLSYYIFTIQVNVIGLEHDIQIAGSYFSLFVISIFSDQVYMLSGNIMKKYEETRESAEKKQIIIDRFINIYKKSKEHSLNLENLTIDNDSVSAQVNENVQKLLEDINELEQLINENAIKTAKAIGSTDNLIKVFQHYKEGIANQQNKIDALSETSQQIDHIIQKRNSQMSELIELSRQGTSHMNESVIAVEKIEENSKNMVEMISLIMEVAERTNILALNAAVEASRAGKAGSGFSIVAKEIKSLSTETTQNADIINKTLQTNLSSITEAVNIIKKVGRSFAVLNKNITSFSQTMEEVVSHVQSLNQQNFYISSENKNSVMLIDDIYNIIEKNLTALHIDANRIKDTQEITLTIEKDMEQLNQKSNLIVESGRKLQEYHRVYNSSKKRIDTMIDDLDKFHS